MKISDITRYGIEAYGIDTLLYTADELDRVTRKLNMAIGRAIPKDKRDILDTQNCAVDVMRLFDLDKLFYGIASERVDELGPKTCLEHGISACVGDKMNPGESVVIKGRLGFSQLAKQIDGDALARDDRNRRLRGLPPNGRPFTQATMHDAEVVFANPNDPTWAEVYVQQRSVYKSKSKRYAGKTRATLMNKSAHLPRIGVLDKGVVNEVKLENELACGIDAFMTARVLRGSTVHNYVSLDWVIVDKLRYRRDKPAVPPALAVETVKTFA